MNQGRRYRRSRVREVKLLSRAACYHSWGHYGEEQGGSSGGRPCCSHLFRYVWLERPIRNAAVGVRIEEGEGGVYFEVLATRVHGERLSHQDGIVNECEELVCSHHKVGVSGPCILLYQGEDGWRDVVQLRGKFQ